MARRTGILAAIAALVSGCSATATATLNALVPASTYEGREGVAFGDGPRQQLDIYRPLPGRAAAPPIVVFFYGGNWESGKRADYRFVGEFLAASGAIALIPDYRLHPQVSYPDFLKDCAAAVAWAFANARALGGDPSRIYVMGHSAGAYNAAMMALDPRWLGVQRERLAGFVGIAGPYDFLPIENPATRRAFSWPDTPRDSQPVEHVSFKAPRTLLIAANKDSLVDPVRNTLGLARRLKAAGVDTTVRLLDGVSHVTVMASVAAPLKFLSPVREEVRAFLGLPGAQAK
jgi:acetyl esterase/lipase